GRLTEAARMFHRSRALGGTGALGDEITLAHQGFGAYADGRLEVALALTEEAVALARVHGNQRAEATALVNLGFFQMWAGEFGPADTALTQAADAFAELSDPYDRYEAPLCHAARGVLFALRGDDAQAGLAFAEAIATAREVGETWYEAIARALRAEFTAHTDPRRARLDATWALRELRRRKEDWWRQWAAQAAAVAAREAGMNRAAVTMLRAVLADCSLPLEKARCQLLLAETLLRNGETDEAAAVFQVAALTFDAAGCRYWAARSYLGLAGTSGAHAARWLARARRGDVSDAAYQRLFAREEELRLVAFGPGAVLRAGQPVTFHSHNAERLLFLLTLTGTGVHVEELADRLWPDAPSDHSRALGRIRTLLWDARQGLGPHAWRLSRRGPVVGFDFGGVSCDLAELRSDVQTAVRAQDVAATSVLARRLRTPLLTRWAYDEWVLREAAANQALADRLAVWADAHRKPYVPLGHGRSPGAGDDRQVSAAALLP
ncbi:MAG TPA: hypothetical protein VGS19_06940, partial [Streptosporangiaceae bacterium]|nr:hypothetical protein [Streptosporangiaceae bacterium]